MIEITPEHETKINAALQSSTEHIAQFFSYSHLPERLQVVSRPFAMMAAHILTRPRNPERTVALRKLLESKDASVRAEIAKAPALTDE